MVYPAVCIEQLDLAAKQLSVGGASYDRFALILTDNVIELMLHRRCQQEFQWDQRKWNLKPKYTLAQKKEVLGHKFPPKVKFCAALGVITAEDADFILNAHGFRNELYHTGIRHDQMLHGLAWHYHEITCGLFGRLEFTSYGWHSGVKVSPTVAIYVDEPEKAYMTIREQLPRVAEKLANSKAAFGRDLGQVLTDYLLDRIEELSAALDFLVTDNPNHMKESEMIEHVQMYDHIHGDDSTWSKDLAKCQTCQGLSALWKKVRLSWTPPIRQNPFASWRNHAEKLRGEKNGSRALNKYRQLNGQMEHFERLVEEAAVQMAVELEI